MEKFRTGRLLARSWQIEDLPLAMELWGDPAVTALIDSRGKLTEAQVHEKLYAEIDRERSSSVQYWALFAETDRQDLSALIDPETPPMRPPQPFFEVFVTKTTGGPGAEARRAADPGKSMDVATMCRPIVVSALYLLLRVFNLLTGKFARFRKTGRRRHTNKLLC
jgi:hypothetical protein